MKRLIILLPLCFLFLGANAQAPPSSMDDFDGCGLDGTAKTANLKKLNQIHPVTDMQIVAAPH